MRLTPKGAQRYSYAREIARLLAEAQSAVAEGNEPWGQLKIAASTTIASYVLPGPLTAFCRTYPRIQLELTVGNTEEVLQRVRDGLYPLGLAEGLPHAPQLRLKPFVEDELVLIRGVGARAEEIVRKTKSLRRARDLAAMPIIWREAGSGTRAVTERALRRAGVDSRKLSHDKVIGGTEGTKAAVAAGLGIAFVSRWSIVDELALGQLAAIPLVDLTIPRTFHWALPTGALPPEAAAVARYLESYPPILG
jgi:DNA-binding transcriptional LysR family regulator